MNNTYQRACVLSLILTVITTYSTFACRIINERIWYPHSPVPLPVIRPVVKPLQYKSHNVVIDVDNQVAVVKLEAEFYNPNSQDLEGTYFFPLPADTAIKDFVMYMNGKKVKGELLDVKRARKIYEDVVRRKKDPALLEFVGMNMIKLRVYPIVKRSSVKINLSYSFLVEKDSGMYRLRYPLLSLAGGSGQLLGKFDIKVNLKSNRELKNIYSSSHKISKSSKGEKNYSVTYSKNKFRPARDFTLFWSESEKDIDIDILTGKDGSNGFFLLLLSGNKNSDVKNTVAREIVFLLDTSGSMQDNDKISQAKRALLTALSLLNKKDSFNIINFSSQIKLFKKQTAAADEANIAAAKAFVNEVQAVGGTAINEALLESLKSFHNTDKLPIVLFLTDGVPTVGESNIDNILNNVKGVNKRKARFFNLGVGYNVNVKLLDKLANTTAGTREYIAPDEDIEVKTGNICSKITSPILTDLSLDFGGAKVSDIFPRRLGDLYAGSQIIAAGKFDSSLKHIAVTLKGSFGKAEKSYSTEFDLSKREEAENIAAIWAMRKVGFILEQIRLNGENTELVEEVRRLGTKYGIVTPYTSFLVVEEGEGMTRNEADAARREVTNISRELKKSFASEDFVGKASQARSRMSNTFAGADVMEEAKVPVAGRLFSRKGEAANKRIRQAEIRYAAGKAFVLNNNKWVESTLLNETGCQAVKIKFLSAEYFNLIKTDTRVAKIVSLGDNVIFKLNGKIYEIVN